MKVIDNQLYYAISKLFQNYIKKNCNPITTQILIKCKNTMHPWCDNHSTSISAYRVWETRVLVQVSKKKLHIHIHLNWTGVKFLFCIK